MESTRKGCWGEERVLRLLRRRGWQLVSQRWSCRYGELDLVLEKQQRLLVVEVKSRRCRGLDQWGLRAFNKRKQLRLMRAIACWQETHPYFAEHSLELVLALVPLPPSRNTLDWIRVDDLDIDAADENNSIDQKGCVDFLA